MKASQIHEMMKMWNIAAMDKDVGVVQKIFYNVCAHSRVSPGRERKKLLDQIIEAYGLTNDPDFACSYDGRQIWFSVVRSLAQRHQRFRAEAPPERTGTNP